jgi:bifunctional enzyme CysN/CysC
MPEEIFHLTSAGSVDNGKSTILARLLLDTGSVFEDQLGGIDVKSVNATTLADLLDGLDSEREQGITIDVAHRFFDSNARRYHLADSPGHEQYTRNMATAASHADGMLLVVDARVGVKPQTRAHFDIARMLGITQFVVAVNKMDLVGYKKKVFDSVSETIRELFETEPVEYRVVPVSGLVGDNIVKPSSKMPWWPQDTILDVLESFGKPPSAIGDTVFSIQYVQRIPGGGRRYLGTLHAGTLVKGQRLVTGRYPSQELSVAEVIHSAHIVDEIAGPAEVSLRIEGEIDLERGDVLSTGSDLAHTDQFEAEVVWLDEEQGLPGRVYLLRLGHTSVKTTMTRIFGLGLDTEKQGVVDHVATNERVRVNLECRQKITLTPFEQLPEIGRFVLVNPDTGHTVATGVINHTLRRADNITAHTFDVPASERAALTGRQGHVAWFTGLSGSGKSTYVNLVSVMLADSKIPHAVLDGDALRLGLNKDLGFSESDRVENIRRTAEVAKMMADSGLIVLVSLISPYQADREHAKVIIGPERFKEVFVDTPLEVCEQRDPKGLYKKARKGLIPNFTGISAPYEVPDDPFLIVSHQAPTSEASSEIFTQLTQYLLED